MKSKEKIGDEVEKTMEAFDNLEDIEENPYLFTRIKAEFGASPENIKKGLSGLILKPAVLILILLLNIFTVLYVMNNNELTTTAEVNYSSIISSEYSLSHSYYPDTSNLNGE